MATTNISIRMDTKLKSDLQTLVSNLGLDMTAFFTMAAKQAVREQGIPFKATMNVPNQDTLDAMAEVEYMMKHPEVGKSYNSFSELLADLDNEDNE